MIQSPEVFSPAKNNDSIDLDETTKVLRGIWGKSITINGVKTKDQHFVMLKYKSQKVAYVNANSVNETLEMAKNSLRYRNQDCYIAKNTYVNHTVHYDTDTLFGIRNVCIDIDNHDPAFSVEDICDTVNILIQDLLESHAEYNIPLPSAVVYTGRGIQMWYFLNCVSSKLSFISTAISEKLCDLYDLFLQDSPLTYDGFEVDRAASTRASGLYRLPGSYNPAAKCVSKAKLWSKKRWDINSLKDEVGVTFQNNVKSTHQNKNYVTRNNSTGSKRSNNGAYLLSFLHAIAESGYYESREVLCHIYHSMLLLYGTEETEASIKVHELNDVFTDPLRERELVALIKCNEKHRYKYRVETIFDKLGISDDMIKDYYNKKAAQKKPRDYKRENAARDNRRLENRIEWHNEIRELRDQGYSIREISRITGRAWKTVKKYADTPMEGIEDALSKEIQEVDYNTAKKRAVRLYKRGFRSPEKIARILDVDAAQAEELLEDYKSYRAARLKKNSTMFLLQQNIKSISKNITTLQQGDNNSPYIHNLEHDIIDIYKRSTSLLYEMAAIPARAQNLEKINELEAKYHDLEKELRYTEDYCSYALSSA